MRDRFRLMEEADNRQINREIQGELVDEFVYTIEDKLQLSYAGVRYAAGLYGGIQVIKVECIYNASLDLYEATAYAENKRTGITLPGTAEHSVFKMIDGEPVQDMFSRRTAVSKATRNALLAVMPVEHVKAVIVQLQESSEILSSEVMVPVVIDVESVTGYLRDLEAPFEYLEITLDIQRNLVKVRPTLFLGSHTWGSIDRAIKRFAGAGWVKNRNRWEVPC
jgi:hypothetical protein